MAVSLYHHIINREKVFDTFGLFLKDDFLASISSLHVLRISSSNIKEETKSLFLENEVETIIKITN